MSHAILKRLMPVAMLCALLAPVAPAAAQRRGSSQDVGRQMEREYGVVGSDTREGRDLNDQLDRVVQRIVGAVNAQHRDRDFRLRSATLLGGRDSQHDRVINAFALPDGRIYVTLGLMRAIEDARDSDDELAFVVGHEVTHVVEHHSSHQQGKAMEAGIAAILLGAVTRNQTLGTLGQYGASAYVSSYSRKDEYAADKGGVSAMRQAGYDPQAAVRMLKRLESKGESSNKTINGWFGSHPLTSNRIDKVQEMIGDQGGRRRQRDDYDR